MLAPWKFRVSSRRLVRYERKKRSLSGVRSRLGRQMAANSAQRPPGKRPIFPPRSLGISSALPPRVSNLSCAISRATRDKIHLSRVSVMHLREISRGKLHRETRERERESVCVRTRREESPMTFRGSFADRKVPTTTTTTRGDYSLVLLIARLTRKDCKDRVSRRIEALTFARFSHTTDTPRDAPVYARATRGVERICTSSARDSPGRREDARNTRAQMPTCRETYKGARF